MYGEKERIDHEMVAKFLASVIDNIQNIDTMCPRSAVYRKLVKGQIERANEIISVNGYDISFKKNPKSEWQV